MFKTSILCCLLLFLARPGWGQEIAWETQLERATAKAAAAEEPKYLLLHFATEWNRPCQQLESFVFSNSMVQSAIAESCIPMKIDVDQRPELAKEFGVTSVPFDVVLTASGRIVMNRPSPLDSFGYARMISSLDKLEINSNSVDAAWRREMSELQEAMRPKYNKLVQKGFEPTGPNHEMPARSAESRDLLQKQARSDAMRVVLNPYFDARSAKSDRPLEKVAKSDPAPPADQGDESDSEVKPEPLRVTNPMFAANAAQTAVAQQPTPPRRASPASAAQALVSQSMDFQPPSSKRAAALPLAADNSNDFPTELALTPPQSNPVVPPEVLPNSAPATLQPVPEPAPVVFALQRMCPVTLTLEGRWTAGDERFGCTHRGRTYLFASGEKLARFRSNPDRFSPLLAGFDPVQFHETGELVEGLADFGVFMGIGDEQQIVLFTSAASRDTFKSDPQLFMNAIRVATQRADVRTIR